MGPQQRLLGSHAIGFLAPLVFACVWPIPAGAGATRMTFTVSAQVVDTCTAEAQPTMAHASCTSGGSVGVAASGAVTASRKGAPMRVTQMRVKSLTGGDTIQVTFSY